jgi:hypothetical protein
MHEDAVLLLRLLAFVLCPVRDERDAEITLDVI